MEGINHLALNSTSCWVQRIGWRLCFCIHVSHTWHDVECSLVSMWLTIAVWRKISNLLRYPLHSTLCRVQLWCRYFHQIRVMLRECLSWRAAWKCCVQAHVWLTWCDVESSLEVESDGLYLWVNKIFQLAKLVVFELHSTLCRVMCH